MIKIRRLVGKRICCVPQESFFRMIKKYEKVGKATKKLRNEVYVTPWENNYAANKTDVNDIGDT